MQKERSMASRHDTAEQLHSLPIPPATLVIDMRNADDDVLDMLSVEIRNLADEMNMKNVDHWRYLTSFIEFKQFRPLSLDDVRALRTEEDKNQVQPRSTTGRYYPGVRQHGPDNYYEDDDIEPLFVDHIPNDDFKSNIKECTRLIDTIRNNRFKAVGDLSRTGKIGPHIANAKVQIIFLIDEEEVDTLSSAATYAAYLKMAYEELERTNLPSIDTMIICLNHNNQANAPRLLINRLRWHEKTAGDGGWWHIDALFLCERFGHNGVRIPQATQPYLAELLLYVQLITPPRMIRPAFPDTTRLLLTPPPSKPDMEVHVKEVTSLPYQTYIVGLNAIEYSGRWGRRYLNYGLVADAIHILQDKQYDQQEDARQRATTWLRRWRINVRQTVPDQVGGTLPSLQAFPHGATVAKNTGDIMATSCFSLDTGEKAVAAFEQYADTVAQTYVLSTQEEDALWQKSSASTLAQNSPDQLTLQSTLNSAPAILQQVNTWRSDEPETPLVQRWHDALRVLGHPDIFPGPQGIAGAIPRARTFLGELSRNISDFQQTHRNGITPLSERRQDLMRIKDEQVTALKEHTTRFPFFAGRLHLQGFMAWVTLLLIAILSALGTIVLFAWLHHFFEAIPGIAGFPDLLALRILGGLQIYNVIVWIGLIIIVLVCVFAARGVLRTKQLSPLRSEEYFLLALIAFPVLGLIVSLSNALVASDPQSYQYLSWISQLPFWSVVIFFIVLIIVIIEILYYNNWNTSRKKVLAQMVKEIQTHQEETANQVKNYLADTIGLELLRKAELTDGKGNVGKYYQRIDQFYQLLTEIEKSTGQQQDLSHERLTPASQGISTEKTPTLEIRTEILDVPRLTTHSRRIGADMAEKDSSLQALAEILLRIMGEEEPTLIEKQMREHPSNTSSFVHEPFQRNQEQRNAQLLLSLTTALAARQEIDALRGDPVSPLVKRYRELDYHVAGEFASLKQLFLRMQNAMGKTSENSLPAQNNGSIEQEAAAIEDDNMVEYAFTIWCQSLWEHKDPELDRLLEARSISEYLHREGYDPQTVRSMLATRTVISGRSRDVGQMGELYILRFPSPQSRRFFEDMGLESHFVDIPDMERLIMLYIHQYVALPHFLIEEVPIGETSPTDGDEAADDK